MFLTLGPCGRFPFNDDLEYWFEAFNASAYSMKDVTKTHRGQFAVKGNALRKVHEKFMEKLLEANELLEEENNPQILHDLERMWGIIFARAMEKDPTDEWIWCAQWIDGKILCE